jgi:hypothetical protein
MIYSSWVEALEVYRERIGSDLDLEYMYGSGSWMMEDNKIACRVGTARKKKYIYIYIYLQPHGPKGFFTIFFY